MKARSKEILNVEQFFPEKGFFPGIIKRYGFDIKNITYHIDNQDRTEVHSGDFVFIIHGVAYSSCSSSRFNELYEIIEDEIL